MKFFPDGYHPKLWSPITTDPQLRFRRVIPFWNVQVMLYNINPNHKEVYKLHTAL
jgi:hypothetical protein